MSQVFKLFLSYFFLKSIIERTMLIYIIQIIVIVVILYVILNIQFHYRVSEKLELYQMDNYSINKELLLGYISDKLPIVFTNMTDESDIQYWNFDYFKQYYPEELLTIISKYNSKKHLRVKVKNIPFEFSDISENEDSEKDENIEYYIEDYNFIQNIGMDSVIHDDLKILFPSFSFGNTYKLNISKSGYTTKLYYKTDLYNYIIQLEGTQKIVLFHPKQSKYLYRSSLYNKYRVQSDVNFWDLDNKKFPMMDKAKYIEIILHPGNILLIPNYWWFTGKSIQDSISIQISVNTLTTHIIKLPEYILKTLHNIRLYKTYNCCCHFIPS